MDYFLRYTHHTANGNLLRLTYNDYQRDAQTQINSLPGYGRFRRTTALSSDDSDEDVAEVVTFVINSFGNKGGDVNAAQVAAARGGDLVTGPPNHSTTAILTISLRLPYVIPARWQS